MANWHVATGTFSRLARSRLAPSGLARSPLALPSLVFSALALSACCFGGGEEVTATTTPPTTAEATATAPTTTPTTAPVVASVASCTPTEVPLCAEFNQTQFAALGQSGAQSICTRSFAPYRATVLPGQGCPPWGRRGTCDFADHTWYAVPAGGEGTLDAATIRVASQLCSRAGGRFFESSGIAEAAPDAVRADANTALTIGQVVVIWPEGRYTGTRVGRIVDVLPDGRITTVDTAGDRFTVARDRVWVGGYILVPNGLGASDMENYPTITDAPLPAGTRIWAHDSWWFRGVVVEDTGGRTLSIHFLGNIDPINQNVTRRNVRLDR